jgi:hypothetical protein
MERKFINYYAIAVGLFLLWMVLRNQIWSNESLMPGDLSDDLCTGQWILLPLTAHGLYFLPFHFGLHFYYGPKGNHCFSGWQQWHIPVSYY